MRTSKISDHTFLDETSAEHPVLYISEAHGSDLTVMSEVAGAFKTHPKLEVKRVQLDQLMELQHSVKNSHADHLLYSNQQAKIINFFRLAKEKGASDIHMLIGINNVTLVQFRVHGELETVTQLDQEEGMTLASTIVMSMCDVAEKSFNPNRAQDGRVRKDFLQGLKLFGARYAHTPAEFGLYVVMRILPDEGKTPPTLDELGFLPEQQSLIRRMLSRPEGVITLSGPTGSGKSTTLRT
ncbi:Flp pilus assembly complex ATPase component TadA, partial [Hafnia alvei]|uniref:ATPase, T2SS/T4P/T4SS family n=1 Tax=Hafnia alvei TaxID=569 RepID=UPI002DBF6720